MIDSQRPDFENTPVSDQRPPFHPQPAGAVTDPRVSIITPCHNVGQWFDDTARCVREQSLQQYEWILVDDGSTDRAGIAVLQRVADRDPRVRVITQPNAGPSVAGNRGAREAQTQFLFWLDSDDLIESTYIEKALW